MRTLSGSRKAVLERESRKRIRSERRFNTPLKHFIQHKYQSIYEEYVVLYNRMNANHPQRRNLSTSATFKEWQACTASESTPQAENILKQAWEETVAVDTKTDVVNIQHDQGSQETTPTETLSPPQPEGEDNNISQQIDNIVNELLQEEVLRDIFHQPEPVDEGIELNIYDEIQGDIEPFDFEIEVEQTDFHEL